MDRYACACVRIHVCVCSSSVPYVLGPLILIHRPPGIARHTGVRRTERIPRGSGAAGRSARIHRVPRRPGTARSTWTSRTSVPCRSVAAPLTPALGMATNPTLPIYMGNVLCSSLLVLYGQQGESGLQGYPGQRGATGNKGKDGVIAGGGRLIKPPTA